MLPVVTAAQMGALDARTMSEIGIPGPVLMENAGRAVAHAALRCAGGGAALAVCGTGNNGGDGYVAARVLRERGVPAHVLLIGDASRVRGDAAIHLEAYRACGGAITVVSTAAELAAGVSLFHEASVIIDGLFGTGLDREVTGVYAEAIAAMNDAAAVVVAIDIPSGLAADTGVPLGISVRADHTVTMACHKPATASAPGFAHCGYVEVAEIGIPSVIVEAPVAQLVDLGDVAAELPRADALDYKNRRGHVLVVAGAPGKRGAGRLAALAALRGGAGLVTLAAQARDEGADASIMTEVACASTCAELVAGKAAVVIGPGLGLGEGEQAVLQAIAEHYSGPVVVDADGLHHLRALGFECCAERPWVLTPHPGEAARLLDASGSDVEADRLEAARQLADRSGATVILKGARTVVASGSELYVVAAGSPALATAGSGDVLAGLIGALLGQGLPCERAALVAVAVHGRAGELGAEYAGPRGMISSDLPELIAEAMAEITSPA